MMNTVVMEKSMIDAGLTTKGKLIAKGSYAYLVFYSVVTILATMFQVVSKVNLKGILSPLIVNLICIAIAYAIFAKKKKGKSAELLSWILGFITVSLPFLAKYNYGINVDWTFAVESYNSSILIVIFCILLHLMFNRRLYIFFSVYAVVNWILFIYIAHINGAVLHFYAMDGDKPIHGAILLREIFFILIFALITYVLYRNIYVIEEYDAKTTKQMNQIAQQANVQKEMAVRIHEKVGNFLSQVEEQNRLTDAFNYKMQNQASTFEEISATLEELFGSSENISATARDQVSGNDAMQSMIEEFREVKRTTRANLQATLSEMEGVSERTTTANERIREVETTIEQIKKQSSIISETVSVIVDIADRINLLSLNASIEAARAGEFGRGFAVVADEIGKLASKTSESIKDIETVLSQSTITTTNGVEVIRTTAENVKSLIHQMSATSDTIKTLNDSIDAEELYLKNIMTQVLHNMDMSKNIGIGTDEQKNAIESTTKAIEHVNEIVGEMVGEIHRLSETSNVIFGNANELMEISKKAT